MNKIVKSVINSRWRSTAPLLDANVITGDIRPWEEVPGPRALPFIGNTWRFIPYIGGYEVSHIDRVCKSLHNRYGKCVRLSGLLGRPDMLFVFDAHEVERVFRNEDALPHRPSMPSLNYYKHVLRKDFFHAEENCAGVIAVHGEAWSKFRGQISKVVLNTTVANKYSVPVQMVSDDLVERCKQIRDVQLEMPNDFLNELHKWSLESLALVFLDTRLNCFKELERGSETQRLIDAVNTFFISVGELELRTPWWRIYPTKMFKSYIEALDVILSVNLKYVEKALAQLEHTKCEDNGTQSLLEQLLKVAGPRVATMTTLDMFLVGIDTTSNAVASILYQLAMRPDIQERIHNEIVMVLGRDKSAALKNGDLQKMPYLKACIKEVLRMFPVVIGNGRQLTRDTVICGYNIPKGTQVIFQHYVMSNSDEYFTDASEFKPERWLTSYRQSNDHRCPINHHAFASLPFGYGKRMCLGRRFADLEIQTVICKMIQSFKLEYHHEPLEYYIHPMYTPNGPLKLKLIDR